MKLRFKISNNGHITVKENQRRYLEKHGGKDFVGSVDERTNKEKQKFIEGAIVPYFYYQHLPGVFGTFKDAREALKHATNHVEYVFDHKGMKQLQTRSMSQIYANKSKTQDFINACYEYFQANGYLFPDADGFKEWQDSSPAPDEVYPPLIEIIERYKQEVQEKYPWRVDKK